MASIAPPGTSSFHLLFGESPVTQYGTWGIANKIMVPRPSKLLGLAFGNANCGKTSLLASNPGALVINLDLSSTPLPSQGAAPPPAQFWPGIDENGQPIDSSGKRMKLDWAAVEKLIEDLVKASETDAPRPDMVVFDSLTALIYNYLHEATLKQFNKDSWEEGRGDAMWEWLNQRMAWTFRTLRAAGYGVWVVGHLNRYDNKNPDGSFTERIALNCPPSFIRRFYNQFELCMGIEKGVRIVTEKISKTISIPGRPDSIMEQNVPREIPTYQIAIENPKTLALSRKRVSLPKMIELPAQNGWAEFEKAYLAAAALSPAANPVPQPGK